MHHPYTYIHYPLSFGLLGARHRQAPAWLATSAHHPHTSGDGHYSLWPLLKHMEEWILRADKAPPEEALPCVLSWTHPRLWPHYSNIGLQQRKMSSYISSWKLKKNVPRQDSSHIAELLMSYYSLILCLNCCVVCIKHFPRIRTHVLLL